ncbi:MAG: hypothetical protein KAI59_01960, partial [Planctomycetes bacterium]|nr:hypothetical protein [Planctomycetota bacterium]
MFSNHGLSDPTAEQAKLLIIAAASETCKKLLPAANAIFYPEAPRWILIVKIHNSYYNCAVKEHSSKMEVQMLKVVNTSVAIDTFAGTTRNQSKDCLKKWLNTVQCLDCVEAMKQLPSNCVDLVVTSPPYDGIRKYNGFQCDLHATGEEILRILKDGGIAVMVIQDQTKNFAKTLTSFRTIVDWCDNIGLRLFETVIYRKHGTEGAWWKYRFRVDHEYMPIFLKGARPQYFNKEPLKILS